MSKSGEHQPTDPVLDSKAEYIWLLVHPMSDEFLTLQNEGWNVGNSVRGGQRWLRKARDSNPPLEKWIAHNTEELWRLYHLLQSSGQDVYGSAFLQTANFFDFARFVFCNSSQAITHRSAS